MRIDWDKVMTQCVVVFVVTLAAGALGILWTGVQSVDERIEDSANRLEATLEVMAPKLDELAEEVREIKTMMGESKDEVLPHRPTHEEIDERVQQKWAPARR
tara:strand:+ start:494 stop:799 length:306 start_codon:yes stop_codon:yes gene_type:complete